MRRSPISTSGHGRPARSTPRPERGSGKGDRRPRERSGARTPETSQRRPGPRTRLKPGELARHAAAEMGASGPPRPPRRPRVPPGRRPGPGQRLANPRRRVRALFIAVLFVFSLFAAQLVRLQGIDAAQVAEQGRELRSVETDVPAQRGALLDRDGVTLAGSLDRVNVVAYRPAIGEYEAKDPATKKVTGTGPRAAAAALAPLLGLNREELAAKLVDQGEQKQVEIARLVKPETWRAIRELAIPGISSEPNSIRSYPAGAPLAPVLGWVGPQGQAADGSGAGVELLYNTQLAGTPGRMLREYSADKRVIPTGQSEITPAVPGTDLQLSLDNDLSWYAYNAIADKVKETESDSGTVVVMEAKTGRLRAVTQFPGFDPKKRGAKGSVLQALPFQSVFEPGSTAKVMSLGAALDTGAITPISGFDVPNRLQRADRTFKDSHDHATLHLTTAGILAQSSNIGTLLAGEKVDPAVLERYYRSFGVGHRSGINFPGESAGLMRPAREWTSSQRFTVMFGQGMSLTAVQNAGVFQTIANGGVRIPPTIVQGVRQDDGTITPVEPPAGVRVLKPQTATDLSIMLEAVVGAEGTAQQAAIAGIPVAGKTGTAQRYDSTTGGYSGYIASFVGFAPADDPELVVAVVLDNPQKGYYGGTLAGPVFQQIMSYALQKFGIPPTGVERTPFPLQVGQQVDQERKKVDPSVIPPSGPVRGGSTRPTVPRVVGADEHTAGSTPSADPSGAAASEATGGGTDGATAR